MISSYSNPKLKNVRELLERSRARKKAGAFVIEGIRMFNETPESLLKEVYISQSFHENNPGISGELVSDEVFKRLSDTKTPQGILAVVRNPGYDFEEVLSGERGLFLLLEGIQDPGNLGTMIRTGEAAGVKAVIMDHDTADIYSPKVVRATMGSIYRTPFFYSDDLYETVRELKQKGVCVYAADPAGKCFYHETEYAEKTAVFIGNEGRGLSRKALDLSDKGLKIPMEGQTESLNAAVAAALIMYDYRNRS